jgi:protease IV
MNSFRRAIAVLGLTASLAWPVLGGEGKVAMLVIEGDLVDRPNPLAWLAPKGTATLRSIVNSLGTVARSDDQGELVVRLKDAVLSRSDIDEIGAAMDRVRSAGKKVRLFAEAYGPSELLLGAHADEVLLQTGGAVSLPGLYAEEMYLADALASIGVKPQLIQIGDYKGANEQFMNNAPSKAWDQNINQLLDSMYEHMRQTLGEGRKLTPAQLDDAMRIAWWADGSEAAKAGLISGELDLPALGKHINAQRGSDSDKLDWAMIEPAGKGAGAAMDMSNPFAMMNVLMKKPDHKAKRPTIAVLHIDGVIVDGESQDAGFMGEQSVGSRTIRNAIEEIRKQDLIKGVVLRIDSPGGSAIASEVIWQGVKRLAEVKPVWVSVGSLAASGGYYIAVSGDKIYVNPSSVVGSIGVVGGKMALGGLYEWGKIRVFPRSRGPMAGMFDTTKPWNEQEVAVVKERMTKTYDLFASRVKAGRAGIDLSRTAEGRLFTGDKALDLKMADEIGGLDDCLTDLASTLGLEDPAIMDFPGPKGLEEFLEDAFKGFVRSPGVASRPTGLAAEFAALLREAVGPAAFESVRNAAAGLMLLRREPVILMSPTAIVVR